MKEEVFLVFKQFDKDEVQGLFNIGTESWAVLIWSYKCIPGAKYIGRPPDHFNAIDLPGMQVLDLQSSACSCTGNPQNTSIQNSTNLTYVESSLRIAETTLGNFLTPM
jgi:hypothetical protein